jgi:hypothetical protein
MLLGERPVARGDAGDQFFAGASSADVQQQASNGLVQARARELAHGGSGPLEQREGAAW